MKTCSTDIQSEWDVSTINVWENEGGAPSHSTTRHQYGRRIEAHRTWTVYHVFTGIPSSADGNDMTGRSHMDATTSIVSLNLRNSRHLKKQIGLPAHCCNTAPETEVCGP